MRTKGTMYCLNEHKPIAAVKSFTIGKGFLGPWHCPDCGGEAVHAKSILARRDRKKQTA